MKHGVNPKGLKLMVQQALAKVRIVATLYGMQL